MTTLLLNTDGSPVSMLPLSVISWQDAIKYMVLEKATVLEWYDNWVVHSARWETKVPAVIILKEYMKKKSSVRFSKQNVYLRDLYVCQYCETNVSRKTATLDHVIPVSKGGKTTFENCVTSCGPCNSEKGDNHKIRPKKMPTRPTLYQLIEQRKKLPFEGGHPSWAAYLGIED